MIDAIILGLKDIIHNIKIYIILILSIITITVIFISSTLSIFYTNSSNQDKRLFQSYQLVPISTNMSQNKQLLNEYLEFIKKSGTSYIISDDLTELFNMNTIITIGDSSLIDKELKPRNDTSGYYISGGNEPLAKIKYANKDIELTTIDLSYDDFLQEIIIEEPSIIINLCSEEDITDWLNYKDGGILLELFSNSIFENDIGDYEKELYTLFDGSFLSLSKIESDHSEKDFIFSYIYPFVMITTICIVISFWLFYSYYLKKMYREYMIHFLYGAQKLDIFIRNSVAMFFVLLISYFMFTIIKQGETSMIVNLGYLLITIFVLILELITVIEMNRNDKLKNIRGGNK